MIINLAVQYLGKARCFIKKAAAFPWRSLDVLEKARDSHGGLPLENLTVHFLGEGVGFPKEGLGCH